MPPRFARPAHGGPDGDGDVESAPIRSSMAKPMSVSRFRIAPATLIAGPLAALMLSACGGGGGQQRPPRHHPLRHVVAGDGQATVTWDDNTAVGQYWLWFAPSVSFSTVERWSKLTSAQSKVGYQRQGHPPAHGRHQPDKRHPWFFAMNGRDSGGKGGPLSATLSATRAPPATAG